MRTFLRQPLTILIAATALGLVVIAIAVGSLEWAKPEPSRNTWLITNVPSSLALLLWSFSVVCYEKASSYLPFDYLVAIADGQHQRQTQPIPARHGRSCLP